jgi:uncharacterized Fe-S radical SAM superfamily protein PflX
VCRTGVRAQVSSYNPHFGEESPLVGTGGSGTIFFAWCNLKCQYCQKDVEITKRVHEFGKQHRFVYYWDKQYQRQMVPVSW